MNLKFTVNKEYLFYLALLQGIKVDGWVGLQNRLWEKYRKGYKFLQGNLDTFFISKDNLSLQNSITDMENLIAEGVNDPVFIEVLNNTENYKLWLEEEWGRNKDRVEKELSDMLGIVLPEKDAEVIVVSNKMRSSDYLESGSILWGHSEDWPNYSIIYLTHEYLHSLFGKSKLEHALIELISDNELRIRFNGEGEYFKINGDLIGHEYLYEIEKELLPAWKDYLEKPHRNIFDLIDKVKITE